MAEKRVTPAEIYLLEAEELLETAENALLNLEKNSNNEEFINTIFRTMHTIKGSGSMFGFNEIAAFTHEFESLFDRVRKKSLAFDKKIADLTLAAVDIIRKMLAGSLSSEDNKKKKILLEKMSEFDLSQPVSKVSGQPVSISPSVICLYNIIFRPGRELFLRGANPRLIIESLRALGNIRVSCSLIDVPSLTEMNAEHCYAVFTIDLATNKGLNAVKDAFIFYEDFCTVTINEIHSPNTEGAAPSQPIVAPIGELLVERGHLDEPALKEVLAARKKVGEIAIEKGHITGVQLGDALLEQKQRASKSLTGQATIRVRNEKLDELVNLVGELVTMQARLSQHNAGAKDARLSGISEGLARLTNDLRDNALSLRMVPVRELYSGLNRLIRDLNNDLGKDVQLSLSGEDTELDKNVLDSLKDPLMHIIRNSIDHGIESPAERTAAGKDAHGTIAINARYGGTHVIITVSDDGKGLSAERIKAKAIEKGLIEIGASISDRAIYQFIFEPGFSTAEKTTAVSGRGVGMDVVRKNIEKLRGSVELDTVPGKGTTISLKIPLTLAIIDGLLVRLADEQYLLNLSVVDEIIEIDRVQRERCAAGERTIISLRDKPVPYTDLRCIFGTPGDLPKFSQLVLTSQDGVQVGIVVDIVIGQYQTVVKPIGRVFHSIPEISGAAILGDGSVALVLDIHWLIKRIAECENKENKENKNRRIQ